MARMRVHELAKELKMTTKELMEKMIEMGIPVKNHMSMVSDSDVAYLKRHFKKEVRKTRVINKKVEPTKIIRRRRARKDEPKPESLEPSEVSEGLEKSGEVVQVEAEPEQDVQEVMAEKSKPEAAEPEVVEEKTPEEEEEIQVPPKDGTEPIAVQETEAAREEKKEEKIEEEEATDGKSEVAMEPPLEESEQKGIAEEVPVVEEPEEAEKTAEEKAKPKVKGPEEPVTAVQNEVMAPEKEKAKEERGKKEEKRPKARRSRRRRKKRSHKVEAAKIIQLPEFIPETEEEARDEDLESKVRVKLDEAPVKKAAKGGKKFKARSEKDEERGEKEIPPRAGKEKRVKEKKAEAEVEEKKVVEAKEEIPKESEPAPSPTAPPKPSKRKIRVEEAIVVGDLAKQMGIKANEVIKKLLLLGLPVTVNQSIDFDTAALVASEFGFEVEKKGFEEEDILHTAEDKPEDLQPRPPVVTVMGHVDHGKTSLLDAIRHTNVTAREAGGITQHIGAYHVTLDKGSIVFLDTPGHEAFTAMRARGARVTDIVILVVAADDGVMEQTVEAINHAKAADVPIIVAINKIDKPNANPERVKRELAEYGLVPEEWGGDTIMVEVSAKKNVGIDELLEMVLLQAELMELKANPNKPARGRVIEAKLEKGRGPVATVLIQEGTIRVGDAYVCGLHYGKVRNLFDDRGRRVSEAGPSMPVEVIGISGVPQAGDDFVVVADEKQAKLVAEHRQRKQREKELSKATKVTLEKLYEQMREGELKELNIVLKADVQGSLEALSTAISRLRHPEIKINVIHAATGSINETDVMLASASNAIVIGFNVRPDAKVEELAKKEHVDVRFYDVIYQVISDIKDAMAGLLEPEYREKILGRAEVRQTFHISKVGTVAGCYVLDGVVMRNAQVRVLRDQVVIYDSKIASLKRFKDDVKEVKAGFECGILVANFNDVKVGDVLEVYTVEEVRPSIDGVMEEQDEKDSTENGNQK